MERSQIFMPQKRRLEHIMIITMEHGSGGQATGELIDSIFAKAFHNDVLAQMEDSAVVSGSERIAVTTDSFVVTPLEFPGGDIGRLCVCGTVNDLLMRGAAPKYLTCGFIIQTGADTRQLERIVASMSEAAREAHVTIVAGDTKVIEGNGGILINTSGIGFVGAETDISSGNAINGDVILVSGNMGDHHAVILSSRMGIENSIESDNAPLNDIVENLLTGGVDVHVFRDVTRGGLATVLKELAEASNCTIELEEARIPVHPQVKDFCSLMGLEPLYMGNEGKLVAIVPGEQGEKALEIMKNSKYGTDAAIIGEVIKKGETESAGQLILKTEIGGRRILDVLQGEGLPRIC